MAYVIKRYSNRKLYDTQESRYVTLEEIEEMIRGGREISVVDAASGEDLTSVTLTQIILENERTRRGDPAVGLPAPAHQARRGVAGLRAEVDALEPRGHRLEPARHGAHLPRLVGAGGLGRDAGRRRRRPPSRERDGAGDDADKLREEVAALRDRLRSLEERLQKRKAESK